MDEPPEQRHGFLRKIQGILESATLGSDCIIFDFRHNNEDENTFTLAEEWNSKANFDNHIRDGS